MHNHLLVRPTKLAVSLVIGLCSVSLSFLLPGLEQAAIADDLPLSDPQTGTLALDDLPTSESSPIPDLTLEAAVSEASPEAAIAPLSAAPLDESTSEPSVVPDLIAEESLSEVTLDATPEEAVIPDLNADDFSNLGDASSLSVVELDPAVLNGSMATVTSVNQLSDVQPTDWAYQALSSLIDRYGCIAGYPDGTFRGNVAMSRYEFAAGLNACLDGFAASLSPDDMGTVDQLVQDFSAELADIRSRVDDLEARLAVLEGAQFSTTTKLSGLAFFHFGSAGADGSVLAETSDPGAPLNIRPAARNSVTNRPIVSSIDEDPQFTFGYLLWLNLSTSFTGDDLLFTQLAVGNGDSPANLFVSSGLYNTYGVPFTDQSGGVNDNDFVVRELFYDFPVGDRIRVAVGPRINWYRYFDGNAYTFFLTGASSFNSSGGTQLNAVDRGAGAVVRWDINNQLALNVGYLGENTEFLPGAFFNTATDPNQGLFNASNTLTVGLTYSPSSRANIRFTYTRSYLLANAAIRDENGNITGFGVGGAVSEPIYGVADDGFGGSIDNASADTYSVNFDWGITDRFGIFSRYSYGSLYVDPLQAGRSDGSIDAQSFQAGLAFPDLGKDGALLTLSYLIPFSVLDGREFLASGGGDGGIQYEFEATYFYPLGNNISLAPTLYVINNPNNFDSNPTIWVGNLRMQYAF
ncbi:iron uptake porin [Leptolyngbya sp. CCY15150]|uniref:iron uptake porin n=1 Tax=Leptolyngbya sp. CCY15150 TaxID=2767772 RepID=UPI001EF35BF6|nr:iron uptake porin [Leptolyngbya sp. CCY15150]